MDDLIYSLDVADDELDVLTRRLFILLTSFKKWYHANCRLESNFGGKQTGVLRAKGDLGDGYTGYRTYYITEGGNDYGVAFYNKSMYGILFEGCHHVLSTDDASSGARNLYTLIQEDPDETYQVIEPERLYSELMEFVFDYMPSLVEE